MVFVGVQLRQNTAAMQTATSLAVYQQHRDGALLEMENAEVAELLLRARRTPDQMTAADSLRYNLYLNLRLNLREAVYTSVLKGTMDHDIAAGWLDLADFRCIPGMTDHWAANKTGFHRAFRHAVDSAFAIAQCSALEPQ